MRVTIDGHPYTAGLRWHPVESQADIAERRAETGLDRGVILPRDRRIVGVGLLADEEENNLPPSAAALLALSTGEAVIAVERADLGAGPSRYWVAAVLHGAVVAGTDVLLEDPDAVQRELRDLGADVEYRITGAASGEFGGDGKPVLSPARTKPRLGAAAVKSLGSAASPGQLGLLAVLVGAVLGVGGWVLLEPEAPAPAPSLPLVDQQVEQRKAAIAARHQALSEALSGFEALALARWARRAGTPFQRSAVFWRLTAKRCSTGACTLAWEATAAGATPAALATALGLSRDDLAHDLRASTVSVTRPLDAAPDRIEATEATVLAGRLAPLVDRCRQFQGRGGTCALTAGQPPNIPNAALLPPELRFQRGGLSLSGPLGRIDALVPLFAGDALTPWVRADSIEFDYARSEFHLEGHYVIP
jgi:hypothetical protein